MNPVQQAIRAFIEGALESTSERIDFDSPTSSGECEMRHFRQGNHLVIFCTDIEDNPGMRITDAAPAPWEAAEDALSESGDQVTWVEHRKGDGAVEHIFDEVTIRGRVPAWRRLSIPSLQGGQQEKRAAA